LVMLSSASIAMLKKINRYKSPLLENGAECSEARACLSGYCNIRDIPAVCASQPCLPNEWMSEQGTCLPKIADNFFCQENNQCASNFCDQSTFKCTVPINLNQDQIAAMKLLTLDPNGNYYLTLPNSNNVSGYTLPSRKPWKSSDSTITTTWKMIRVDPLTLKVHTGDYTYSESQGQISHWPDYSTQVPYGTAFGCQSSNVADGIAVIDLTGTAFTVIDSFGNGGYLSAGNNAVFSQNNQVVHIAGGGYCGWGGPASAVAQGEGHMHIGGFDIQLGLLSPNETDVTLSDSSIHP